nr:acyl-CoA-binding domain-containing protein 5 isoform X1 [Pelodiscus sinensis]XP_014425129.1 acyl-CoA-binding domain-containing protein 5 isoform X1 [Pelodiscus sinensis]XP_014425131.1 acyl-CoA-binding domain-containing protein 5 isoform X1 [Pelodiscus sinensis]|eukprot:XP_014425128.1 acyl-CoA-binding domain-containing protein 5 isoform X1 [Pelodiscus sinensis]
MAETGSVHETRFEAAVKVIQSLPKNGSFQPTNEMMLKFYSFYKQATQGPCNSPRPGFWDPIGRYKWDAWSALGDMPKEEAMIAYVEEMKKILESMPMTEKVEELLHVIGPFYEIVEEKKNRGSGLTSVRLEKVSKYLEDLGNVMTSTPNSKAVNGKAESSDSGAESEEAEDHEEEEKEIQQSEKDYENLKQDSTAVKDLESIVTNGCYKDSFISDLPIRTQTKSALNSVNMEEEIKKVEQKLELTVETNNDVRQGANEDSVEEISGIQHLTSDSDSEVYCDSMEQFGQEEPLEIITSAKGSLQHSSHFLEVDHSHQLENAVFSEHAHLPAEDIMEVAVEGKGEVKCGGEDGKSSDGGPHKEKKGGEKVDFHGVRRGRGHRMQPLGDGAQGGQIGSGGDGERWGSDRALRGSLNEQIAVVLMRLQEDMQNVLQRLHTLEALTASQARSLTLQSNLQPASPVKRPSWWPFEISPGTLAFAVVWPFIAQWLMHVYFQRRRRKLN